MSPSQCQEATIVWFSYFRLHTAAGVRGHYSTPVPVVIYDSTCMVCTMPGGRIVCKQRNDICVTGDVCYSLSSKMCRNKKNHDDDDGDDNDDDHDDKHPKLWIIGAVLGGLAFIAVIVGIICKAFAKSKMHVQDQYTDKTYEDLHAYSNPPAATHYTK